MLRVVLGIVAALAVNMLVVTGCEMLLARAYPPPAGANLTDPATLATFVRAMPARVSAGLLAGWAAGAWAAAAAGWLVSGRRAGMSWPGPGFNLLGVAISVHTLPHPAWVAAVGLAMPIAAGLAIPRLLPARRLA